MEISDINKKHLQTGKLTSKLNSKPNKHTKSSKNSTVPAVESVRKVRTKSRCYT